MSNSIPWNAWTEYAPGKNPNLTLRTSPSGIFQSHRIQLESVCLFKWVLKPSALIKPLKVSIIFQLPKVSFLIYQELTDIKHDLTGFALLFNRLSVLNNYMSKFEDYPSGTLLFPPFMVHLASPSKASERSWALTAFLPTGTHPGIITFLPLYYFAKASVSSH